MKDLAFGKGKGLGSKLTACVDQCLDQLSPHQKEYMAAYGNALYHQVGLADEFDAEVDRKNATISTST